MPDETAYTLSDLCELAEVTPRTVRYYIAEGLLRSPGAGPGAKYDGGHLARLRLIRRLQKEHLPLAEIRNRLRALTDADVQEIVSAPPPPPAGSAADYVRAVLAGRGTTPVRTLGPVVERRTPPRPEHPLRGLLAEPVFLGVDAPPVDVPPATPAIAGPGEAPATPPTEEELASMARAAVREIPAAYDTAVLGTTASVARTADRPGERHAHDHPERSQWERISLTPDLELHVRRPLSRLQNRQLSRLLQLARELLEEDVP